MIDFSIKVNKYKKRTKTSSSILNCIITTDHASVVNIFRRIATSKIPVYAFNQENMYIEKNTAGDYFNDDEIKARISMIGIPSIPNSIIMMTRSQKNKGYKDINYKHPDDNILIEFSLEKVADKGVESVNVTTDDMKIFINGKYQQDIFADYNPISLFPIKGGSVIKCTGTAGLSIISDNKNTAIFSAATTYSNMLEKTSNMKKNTKSLNKGKHDYSLTIESRGQITEKTIMLKVCDYILAMAKTENCVKGDDDKTTKDISTHVIKSSTIDFCLFELYCHSPS